MKHNYLIFTFPAIICGVIATISASLPTFQFHGMTFNPLTAFPVDFCLFFAAGYRLCQENQGNVIHSLINMSRKFGPFCSVREISPFSLTSNNGAAYLILSLLWGN